MIRQFRSLNYGDRLKTERLFLTAERIAQEFNLFPTADPKSLYSVQGLLSEQQIQERLSQLHALDVDSYIEQVVVPAESPNRTPASVIVQNLGRVTQLNSVGPYLDAIVEMDFSSALGKRMVAFLAQDRVHTNGVWGPEEHARAAEFVQATARRSIPVVSLMDTPGAAADESANRGNQAHHISRLIAVMSDLDVPNIGVILGIGYSGGAIPLAASNMILSVRDGVFSTIQPRGLASIARRLNLSWQECAKHVGLSPYELLQQGNIDGVIDYVPGESGTNLENFRRAIVTGIASIEASTKAFVAQEEMFVQEYQHVLNRYLNPTERMKQTESASLFEFVENPTDYLNVFGLAYRHSRYLRVRRRIKSTKTSVYGRLAQRELPEGELLQRIEFDRRKDFLLWLQDPDRIVYDDTIKSAWRNYLARKSALGDQRNRLQRALFGEPKKNLTVAQNSLFGVVCAYLVNRWKASAADNLKLLIEFLRNESRRFDLVHPQEIMNPRNFLEQIESNEKVGEELRKRFTHHGSKLVRSSEIDRLTDEQLTEQIALELNLAVTGSLLPAHAHESEQVTDDDIDVTTHNRKRIEKEFGRFLRGRSVGFAVVAEEATINILDILQQPDLKSLFVDELEHHLVFDQVYDGVIRSLDKLAAEAKNTHAFEAYTIRNLLLKETESAIRDVKNIPDADLTEIEQHQQEFFAWYLRFASNTVFRKYLVAVEEWKKAMYSNLSDTLFVVVTFIFEKLVVSYLKYESENSRYNGRITPRNIGRRRDFWNRLNNAYRDLQIQEVLKKWKQTHPISYDGFIEKFFDDFEHLFDDQLSSDPVHFPGFRMSIEKAMDSNLQPCGVVTGIGTFKNLDFELRVGTVISNTAFQAGAFDMASAEKFCRLLHTCADRQLPVICFISSGGMQTKEGAGALFSMAAINDRITHFVRDYDLPIVVFGYGDCTGGAQASFVTHPLVHTYYFAGTSLPFAGQIVVPSYLPLDSILSNYLVKVPGSMQGLVRHPFFDNLDEDLQKIDPDIPASDDSVEDVVKGVMEGALTAVRTVELPAEQQQKSIKEEDLYRPIKKVMVHARGCAAVKIVRVAQRQDIDVVLVQSDPDMESVAVDFLRSQDELICIGGSTPDESYLNARSVLMVADQTKVDSLHPGIGFLSENSQFARLIRRHGINFVGPPVASMETMGNKSNAINTALKLGIPVVPGSHGIVDNVERAIEFSLSIGFPMLIKAVHGGGGKGIQLVESPNDFIELFQRVSVEARAAFGSGDVYLEKYITNLRHIEVQILRDSHGNTKVLGIRDCSVQRNRQKIFEESASTMLPSKLERSVHDYSAMIADEVGYVGAGTVEFIYDLDSKNVYFMEMNTRLQVEHPVTELVSEVDIVAQQFAIASGASISDLRVGSKGYAIEARINAETVARDGSGKVVFRPSAGLITKCDLPEDPRVEVISIAAKEKFISPYYDSMIAQIIAHGSSRNSAADRLFAFLDQVRLEGIGSNVALLKRILQDEVFRGGDYSTDYLPDFLERTDTASLITEMQDMCGKSDSEIDTSTIAIEGSDEVRVLSPTTGIFYSRPSPTDTDYVNSGDIVDIDAILCQIEAFKVFAPLRLRDLNTTGNEELYPNSKKYKVTRINVATGQQINTSDLLFIVKPQD